MQNIDIDALLREVTESINKILNKLESISDFNEISKLKNKGLDIFNKYFSYIKDVPPDKRKFYGQELNKRKNTYLEQVQKYIEILQIKSFKTKDQENKVDISEIPFSLASNMHLSTIHAANHPLMLEIAYMNEIWQNLGFKVFEGRELDTDEYVFEKLNIPKGHPAREMWDTFYTEEGYVPTTQTSNMQIRMMQYFKNPPIRAAVYGKVFRNEELDAVHSHTFFQYEIIYIDKNVSISNLIAVLVEFLKMYYKKEEIEYRIMPAHFPFVEPGLEMHLKNGDSWLEILGAGMVHPKVLQAGGIDPSKFSGFAAGFGIDRMVMLKYGITDLRDLYQGNITMFAR